MVAAVSSDPAMQITAKRRKTHQQRVPQYYSALITMGWKRPMHKKEETPMIMPVKFIVSNSCF